MPAYSDQAFSTRAFSISAFDFGEAGGFFFFSVYGDYHARKRERKERREQILEDVRKLKGIDREIADILQKDQYREERERELAELEELVEESFFRQGITALREYGVEVEQAYLEAATEGQIKALERLEREVERAMEEEEHLLLSLLMME